jgi:hypothetical protein
MVNEYRNEFENHDIIVDNKELITVKTKEYFYYKYHFQNPTTIIFNYIAAVPLI